MKIIVFGGAGFLGSHVCDQLSISGHKVRIFDRAESPWRRPDQEMIIGDLLDESRLVDAIEGCDVVYNFAAISDLDESLTKPIETVKINVLGNVLVLNACQQAEVQRYVYASTVYVYSRHGGFYRCSKQSSEQYVEEYQKTYDRDVTFLGERRWDENILLIRNPPNQLTDEFRLQISGNTSYNDLTEVKKLIIKNKDIREIDSFPEGSDSFALVKINLESRLDDD